MAAVSGRLWWPAPTPGSFIADREALGITSIGRPARNQVATHIPIPAWSGISVGAGPGWADARANTVYRIDLHASG